MLTSQSIRKSCEANTIPHSDEFLYCLVDHAGMPGLHRELFRTKAEWVSLFENTSEAGALQAAPLLFRIHVQHEPGRADPLPWVVANGTYTSSMMFLATPLPLRELASRLTSRLEALISQNMEVLLRFYDPRIFEQLMVVLSSDQRKTFLSVGRRWWFVNRRGELGVVAADYLEHDRFSPPMELSASQETLLLDASEPDLVAAQVISCVPDEYGRIPPQDRHAFISRQIDSARTFGITATYELALYCALSLLHGSEFPNGPHWKSLFDEVRCGRIKLTDAISESRI
jgi:hypothetical protein